MPTAATTASGRAEQRPSASAAARPRPRYTPGARPRSRPARAARGRRARRSEQPAQPRHAGRAGRAGRGEVGEWCRSFRAPTTRNSRAEMTPWATFANSAACRPVSGERGDAEQHEAHVRHRREGDQPLEVALDEAGQAAPEDAGDAERRRAAAPGCGRRRGTTATGEPDQAVGAHLEQHRRPAAPTRRWGRSVCAGGSQVCSGNIGAFTGRPSDEQRRDEQLAVGAAARRRPPAASAARSVVPAEATRARSRGASASTRAPCRG